MADRPLVGSHQPALNKSYDTMNPRHQIRCRLLFPAQEGHIVAIAIALQREVSEPTVCVDDAARFDRVPYERHQAFRRSIDDLAHANSTDARPILLSGNHHQRFVQVEPTWESFFQTTEVAFVDFDKALVVVAAQEDGPGIG